MEELLGQVLELSDDNMYRVINYYQEDDIVYYHLNDVNNILNSIICTLINDNGELKIKKITDPNELMRINLLMIQKSDI